MCCGTNTAMSIPAVISRIVAHDLVAWKRAIEAALETRRASDPTNRRAVKQRTVDVGWHTPPH
jgi:hypothetical protein